MKKVKKRYHSEKKDYKSFVIVGFSGILFIGLLIGIIMAGKYFDMMGGVETVAVVNGHDITNKEFQATFASVKADTISYFKEKYKVEKIDDKEWDKKISNEVPNEKARELALEKIKKFVVAFELAEKDTKIKLKGFSYKDLYKQMEEQNKYISKLYANQGNTGMSFTYTFDNFYVSYANQIMSEVKTNLGDTELKATDENLKKHFEENKDKFKKRDIMESKIITINKVDKSISDSDYEKLANEVKSKIENSTDLDKVKEEYSKNDKINLTIEDKKFDDSTEEAEAKDNVLAQMANVVSSLEEGKVSSLFDSSAEGKIKSVAKLIKKTPNGYKEFAKAKEEIKASYIDLKYDEKSKELEKKVKVTTKPELKKIK